LRCVLCGRFIEAVFGLIEFVEFFPDRNHPATLEVGHLVAGLRLTGMVAPMVLDGPIDRIAFQAYFDQVLVPELAAASLISSSRRNVQTTSPPL
jgi:hypothetical protein